MEGSLEKPLEGLSAGLWLAAGPEGPVGALGGQQLAAAPLRRAWKCRAPRVRAREAGEGWRRVVPQRELEAPLAVPQRERSE